MLRPTLETTAAERVSVEPGGTLAFFDELETRPVIGRDDVLMATLLLGTGASPTTPSDRVASAKKLGYVPAEYAFPPRQAATAGDVAQVLGVILDGPGAAGKTPEEALKALVSRGLAPAALRPNQGLTGAQLVSIIGAARDQLAESGSVKTPLPELRASETAAGSTTSSKAPKRADGRTLNRGRPEPLPIIPPGTNPPAIDIVDPGRKPAIIGPGGTPTTPGASPTPKPTKPSDAKASDTKPATTPPK